MAGCVKTQTKQCLKNIKAILTSIDVPFDDIVKINIYLKDLSKLEAVNQVHAAFSQIQELRARSIICQHEQ